MRLKLPRFNKHFFLGAPEDTWAWTKQWFFNQWNLVECKPGFKYSCTTKWRISYMILLFEKQLFRTFTYILSGEPCCLLLVMRKHPLRSCTRYFCNGWLTLAPTTVIFSRLLLIRPQKYSCFFFRQHLAGKAKHVLNLISHAREQRYIILITSSCSTSNKTRG